MQAKEHGFDFCGIAQVELLDEHRQFNTEFIRNKRHLSFSYLETNLEKRLDPLKIMPDARSVIAVLLNYYPDKIIPEEDNFIISKYAYSKDYYSLVKKKLQEMILFMKQEYGELKAQLFVDSGVVLEKVWAQQCGIGWQGKNTLLINSSAGSFFFIGIILTNLELEPDQPEKDHCGSCSKCQDACPTRALANPYQLDISRCIAYLTIESKNEIPSELKDKFKDRIYGCDICQDVCPYNKFATPHHQPDFHPSANLSKMRKNDWLNLTKDQFDELFRGSSIKKTGYNKLMSTIKEIDNQPNQEPTSL